MLAFARVIASSIGLQHVNGAPWEQAMVRTLLRGTKDNVSPLRSGQSHILESIVSHYIEPSVRTYAAELRQHRCLKGHLKKYTWEETLRHSTSRDVLALEEALNSQLRWELENRRAPWVLKEGLCHDYPLCRFACQALHAEEKLRSWHGKKMRARCVVHHEKVEGETVETVHTFESAWQCFQYFDNRKNWVNDHMTLATGWRRVRRPFKHKYGGGAGRKGAV